MLKKLIVSSLLSLVAISGAYAADDVESRAPAACGMSFEVKGGGLQLIVGDFQLNGVGVIKCIDFHGVETRMPVEVQIGGRSPVALKLAAGRLLIAGVATGIGWARSPEELAGRYLTLEADGAFLLGAGASVSARLARHDAATLDVAMQVEHGLGFNVGFNSLTIRLLN